MHTKIRPKDVPGTLLNVVSILWVRGGLYDEIVNYLLLICRSPRIRFSSDFINIFGPHCMMYTRWSTLHGPHWMVHTKWYTTLHDPHSVVNTVWSTLHGPHCMIHTKWSTLHDHESARGFAHLDQTTPAQHRITFVQYCLSWNAITSFRHWKCLL